MMKNRKASKIGTVAAILASVFLSGTTVFGYAPMQTTEVVDSTPITEEASFVETSDSKNLIFKFKIFILKQMIIFHSC